MREELISAAKAAINRDEHNIGAQTFDEIHTRMATATLDAILAGLDEPSEEMLQAGFAASCLDWADKRSDISDVWQAMLKPLKGE